MKPFVARIEELGRDHAAGNLAGEEYRDGVFDLLAENIEQPLTPDEASVLRTTLAGLHAQGLITTAQRDEVAAHVMRKLTEGHAGFGVAAPSQAPTRAFCPGFSTKASLGAGWRAFKANAFPLIGFSILLFALWIFGGMIQDLGFARGSFAVKVVSWIASVVFNLVVSVVYMRISLDLARDPLAGVRMRAFLPSIRILLCILGVSILTILILVPLGVVMGIAVMFVGGASLIAGAPPDATSLSILFGVFLVVLAIWLYLMFRLFFANYAVVDDALGPVQAMRQSWRITRRRAWALSLFSLALLGVNLLGVLCLGIGMLITLPISLIAVAHAYLCLKDEAARSYS